MICRIYRYERQNLTEIHRDFQVSTGPPLIILSTLDIDGLSAARQAINRSNTRFNTLPIYSVSELQDCLEFVET